MTFVRDLDVKVTVLHQGSVLSEGTLEQSRPIRRSSKSISDGEDDQPEAKSASAARSMLEAKNVDLYYGAAQALRGVSLTAENGKVTCLMGRNGVGKTSLLRAIVGQRPIAGGEIVWEGKVLGRMAGL